MILCFYNSVESIIFCFQPTFRGTAPETPMYIRVVEVNKSDENDCIVKIQIINKNIILNMKPEEILADDNLVDQFSPRDVRLLTYLGYLEINKPKYEILAQRLSKTQDSTIFALKKKGEEKPILKSASEIIKEKDIINSLPSDDAQKINFLAGSESIKMEKTQQESLKHKAEN